MTNALAGPGKGPGEGGSAAAGAGARWLMRGRRGAAPTASVADDADGVENAEDPRATPPADEEE